jgi:hypothetical protein
MARLKVFRAKPFTQQESGVFDAILERVDSPGDAKARHTESVYQYPNGFCGSCSERYPYWPRGENTAWVWGPKTEKGSAMGVTFCH